MNESMNESINQSIVSIFSSITRHWKALSALFTDPAQHVKPWFMLIPALPSRVVIPLRRVSQSVCSIQNNSIERDRMNEWTKNQWNQSINQSINIDLLDVKNLNTITLCVERLEIPKNNLPFLSPLYCTVVRSFIRFGHCIPFPNYNSS